MCTHMYSLCAHKAQCQHKYEYMCAHIMFLHTHIEPQLLSVRLPTFAPDFDSVCPHYACFFFLICSNCCHCGDASPSMCISLFQSTLIHQNIQNNPMCLYLHGSLLRHCIEGYIFNKNQSNISRKKKIPYHISEIKQTLN